MNLDFHYYGTYCAARIAGYPKDEAGTIAYYAQFVDECTKKKLSENGVNKAALQFEPQPTVQSNAEITGIISNPLPLSEEQIKEFTFIWSSFHFLPGNTSNAIEYGGPPMHDGAMDSWGDKDVRLFKLLCLPNSDLEVQMMEETRNAVRDEESQGKGKNALQRIGMAMHILADTWAHAWFAGTPMRFLNDAVGDVYEKQQTSAGLQWVKLKFFYDFSADNVPQGHYSCVPKASRDSGMFYLGHGRMGHLPDYSFMTYRYQPIWEAGADLKNPPVPATRVKTNPDWFLQAFCQMIYAMKCIRGDVKFEADKVDFMDTQQKQDVESVLATRTIDSRLEWESLIKKWYGKDGSLKPFDADQTFAEYKSAGEKGETPLYRFLKAADEHVKFIKKNIKL